MEILKALGATITKMFVADFWLAATALIVVAACAAAVHFNLLSGAFVPPLLGAGVLAALVVGVVRGWGPRG